MSTKYNTPSVEAIQEDSEDEPRSESRGKTTHTYNDTYHRQQPRASNDAMMVQVRANTGRERERRRSHKSTGGSRHSKSRGKDTETKRISINTGGRPDNERPRIRHRRTMSNRTSSSTSSSDNDEEYTHDHREVLAQARSKLTSPSMLSTFTSLTTSTNKSSGSSGSNSTITQASMSKKSLGKRPELPEAPMSPAAPDPPNVFAYLDNSSTTTLANEEEQVDEPPLKQEESDESSEEEGQESEEEQKDEEPQSQWSSHEYEPSSPHLTPNHGSSPPSSSSSSSASSSIHGSDHFSEPTVDNDTDRSTSPERSIKDHTSDQEQDEEQDHDHDHIPEQHSAPTDTASAKLASQIAAAQHRQNQHANNVTQNFGTPNMARGTAVYPYHPSGSALSPRHTHMHQHVKQRSLPRAEKIPVTGYELLASRLSAGQGEEEGKVKIKPMYRKFEALNHRLLLHLQDEIGELEERLHRLDLADTQSRTAGGSGSGSVVPASRRAAQAAGGELQWHKTDVLGRIGFKLAQYNQALSAFNTTQSLPTPDPEDITTYRTYLSTTHPIAEVETHFLDPTDDLVSICSERASSRFRTSTGTESSYSGSTTTSSHSPSSSQTHFTTSPHHNQSPEFRDEFPQIPNQRKGAQQPPLPVLALSLSLAVAVLLPILTFQVIPGFIGRMTVVGLVGGGVVGGLFQGGVVGRGGGVVAGWEGVVCAGVYGGVMVVVAGILG